MIPTGRRRRRHSAGYAPQGNGESRVHFMRNAMAYAGKTQRRVVSAWIGTAFAQDDADAARKQWRQVADQLRPRVAKLAALMDDAEADVLAYMGFPGGNPFNQFRARRALRAASNGTTDRVASFAAPKRKKQNCDETPERKQKRMLSLTHSSPRAY